MPPSCPPAGAGGGGWGRRAGTAPAPGARQVRGAVAGAGEAAGAPPGGARAPPLAPAGGTGYREGRLGRHPPPAPRTPPSAGGRRRRGPAWAPPAPLRLGTP